MTSKLSTRRRLARIRAIQLKAETLDLALARLQLARLEEHRTKIDQLAASTTPEAGHVIGRSLSGQIELRYRLIDASQSLTGLVGAERATVAVHEQRCIEADRNKQLVDKLVTRADRKAALELERRRTMPARRRQTYADSVPYPASGEEVLP